MVKRTAIKTGSNNLVKESNAIARAQLSPPPDSVWSERLIAQVAAFNRMDSTEFPETAFLVGQLTSNYKKISNSQLSEIKKAAESLVRTTFTVHYNHNHFRTYSVFEYIEYDCGIITAKFNKSLKPHYLELRQQFAIRALPEFKQLTSIYSQQFFRFLNSWASSSKKTIPISELHQLTTAPISFKTDFRNFRKRVLEIAHKEINAKTSLKFDWEAIKTGRKVTAVRFVFGELGIKNLEKTRHTSEKKTEKEILLELQSESFACWKKYCDQGKTCKPRKTAKCCEYCQTRGKMSFSK